MIKKLSEETLYFSNSRFPELSDYPYYEYASKIHKFNTYDDAYEYAKDHNLDINDIVDTGSQFIIKEQVPEIVDIESIIYTFDIARKYGRSDPVYVSTLQDYESKCDNYTDLNKEVIHKYNLDRHSYIVRSSIKINKINTNNFGEVEEGYLREDFDIEDTSDANMFDAIKIIISDAIAIEEAKMTPEQEELYNKSIVNIVKILKQL